MLKCKQELSAPDSKQATAMSDKMEAQGQIQAEYLQIPLSLVS